MIFNIDGLQSIPWYLPVTCQSWGLKMILVIFFMNLRSLFCYWRSSFMKSWQKSLKFSIPQLNQNDITTKLFNPSVVWQGSVVFGEVILFIIFLCSYHCATSVIQISVIYHCSLPLYLLLLLALSFQGQTRTVLPGFNLCFEKSNKKMEPSLSSSQCQEKRLSTFSPF